MNTNFNILIGANTSKLESDIKSAINDIGYLYPVQVEAVLSNESEILGQIENIAKKLRALGNVSVGFGDSTALGSLDKDLSKAGSEAQKIAKSMDTAFEGMSKEVKETTKEVGNLLKVTEKLSAESKEVKKATTVTGNDYFTEKTTSVLPDEGDKLIPESIEKVFDYKKLSKYVNSINDDLAKWGNTVDLSGEKIERIKKLISTIDNQYEFDPQGAFIKDLKTIEELHRELSQISNIIDKQVKASEKHLNNVKKADLSMLKPEDVNRLENNSVDLYNESNIFKDKDYWNDGQDDKFFENLEYQKQKLEESLNLNKELKQKQAEIEKTSKAVSANIEKWKDNGLLANSEIKKIEDTLASLNRHSESFEDDLKGVQKQANELSVKEQGIIQKQKDDEQARLKIQQAQIDYQIKINKLKEDGYYNHLQLKTLEKSFDKLHDGEVRDLEQANKLIDELNTKYKKASDYAEGVKKKSRLADEVKGAKNKLSNIDQDLLTTPQARKDYKSYEGQIEKLGNSDISKKQEKDALKRINELYEKLLGHQKESIANKKLELQQTKEMEKLQEHLQQMEQKTIDEENNLKRELIEQQQRAKKEAETLKQTQEKEMEQVYASLARIEEKHIKEQNDRNRMLTEQQQKANEKQRQLRETQAKEMEQVYASLEKIEQKHVDEENARRRTLAEQQERDYKERLKAKKDEEELAELMAEGREKAQAKRENDDNKNAMSEATKEAKKQNNELERQYQNQIRITEATRELDEELREISNRDLFDDADLANARQMLSQLSKESNTLESDLRAIRAELKNVNKEINNRQQKQSNINKTVDNYNSNADKFEKNNILPDDLIQNFRGLSNSLSLDSLESEVQAVENEFRRLLELQEELNKELKNSERYEKLLVEARQQMVKIVDLHEDKLENINYNLRQQLNDTQNIEQVQGMINNLTAQLAGIKRNNVRLTDEENKEIKKQIKEIERTTSELRGVEKEMAQIERKTQSITEKLESMRYRATRGFNNSARQLRQITEEFDAIESRRQKLLTIDTSNEDGRKQYKKEYEEIEQMMNLANRNASDLRDEVNKQQNSIMGRVSHAFKQVPIWMSAMGLFYGLTSQVQQGFQSMLDIDEAMTNLAKVTDATNSELERFKTNASDIGNELGVLTADVINSTAEFQKLGYSLSQSTALASNTILYANVGDMNIEDATSYMVSSIKGFNIEVDKSGKSVEKIIDIFNAVSNNYAISAEGIGQALQRSSAVLTQAGNSIEQSVALVTSANTTIQDPMKVGNALKTISMRLRGVDEEGGKVANLVPELESTFNSFGATIMKDADTFKTTYDIMDTLHDHWDELTDLERANITELIGGKEQGAIVSSMIANWSDALGSYETALDSSGSAQREFQKYTESFAYKINSLKVALEEMWTTIMDDRAFKSAIDSLTSMVHGITWVVDTFGAIPTIIGTATLALTLFSKTARKTVLDTGALSESFGTLMDVMGGTSKNTNSTASAVGGFGLTIAKTAGRLFAFTAIIMGVTWAITKFNEWRQKDDIAREENIKRIDDEIMKYEELKSNLEGFSISEFSNLRIGFENGTLDDGEMQEYLDMKDKIVNEMPELVQSFNENGEAIIKTKDKVEELLDAKERLYAQNLREKAELTVEDMDTADLEAQIMETRNLIRTLNESNEEEEATIFIENWIKANADAIEEGGEELEVKLDKLYADVGKMFSKDSVAKTDTLIRLNNFIPQLEDGETKAFLDTLSTLKDEIKLRSANLASEVQTSKDKLSNEMVGFNEAMSTAFESAFLDMDISKNSNEYLLARQLSEMISENIYSLRQDYELEEIIALIPEWLALMLENAEKADVDLDSLFDMSLDGDELKAEFDKFIKSVDGSTKEGKLFIEMLKTMKKESLEASKTVASQQVDPFASLQTQAIPALDSYMSNIRELDDAYRKLAEGQSLTNDEVLKLVANNPTLNKSLTIQNGHLKLNKEALQAVAKEHQNTLRATIESAQKSAKASQEKAKANIIAIFSEVKALKILSNATREQARQAMYSDEKLRNTASPTALTHMERQLNQYYDYADELSGIQSILNSLNSGGLNLGSSALDTSGSSSKAKDSAKDTAQSLQDSIYIADKYKLKMDELNTSIDKLQKQRENMSSVSNEYRQSLKQEIDLTNQKSKAINDEIASLEKQISTKTIQQKGLVQLGKDDNRTARAKSAELNQQIDELKGSLNQLRVEAEEIKNTSISLNMDYIEAWTNSYALEREVLTDDIAYQEYLMSMYDQNSKAYRDSANEKIRLMKVQEKYWQKELDYLENQKKANKDLTGSQILEMNQKIREARENLYSINKGINDEQTSLMEIEIDFKTEAFEDGMDKFDDAIKKTEKSLKALDSDDYVGRAKAQDDITASYRGQAQYIREVIRELEAMKVANAGNYQLVNKINDELKNWKTSLSVAEEAIADSILELKGIFEDLADDTVEAHKEAIQRQIDAEEDLFDEMMDGYERVHEKKMAQYERELDILSDIYDKQIEMINREDESRTYDNTLAKLRKEADKLQKQIDLLSLDDSYDSIAKREDLKEQLAEKNEEIDDLQYEREKDLRIQSLEDAKDIETEKLEDKKDIYEDEYDEMVRLREKEHQLTIKSLEDRLNDERYYSQLRQDVIDGEFEKISSLMEEFTGNMDFYSQHVGKSLTQNIIDKLTETMKSIKELNSISVNGTGKTNSVTSVSDQLKDKNGTVVQTGNTGTLGTASGNKTTTDSSKETKYSTTKIVKAKWDCWLFSTTTKDEAYKIKQLTKGSQWKAHGENSGYYNLGSGYSDKGNFDVVANTSGSTSGGTSGGSTSGSTSGGTSQQRYYTVVKGDTMSEIAQKYYGKASDWKKIQNANPSVNPNKMQIGTKLLIPFRTGGYTGDWSGDEGRLAILHKKEQVLNEDQTQDIFKAVESLKEFKRMRVQNANISVDKENPVQQITNEYNITLEIENMNGDKKSADIVSDQIIQNMKRTKGGRFY